MEPNLFFALAILGVLMLIGCLLNANAANKRLRQRVNDLEAKTWEMEGRVIGLLARKKELEQWLSGVSDDVAEEVENINQGGAN